jgi:hypothetical protein
MKIEKNDKDKSLIPVYTRGPKEGESLLKYRDMKNITLDIFMSLFLKKLIENYERWHWLHARVDAVCHLVLNCLTAFCHDPDKIKKTQDMIFVMMHEHRLREFILDKKAPYDGWAYQNTRDEGIKMLESLCGITAGLNEELQKTQDTGKVATQPFISYFNELSNGQRMKDIKEFIEIFNKPLEFTFLIANHREFNDCDSMLRQYRNNPEGSYNRTEKMRYGVDAHEIVAHFFDGDKKIAIEEYSYMQGMQESKEEHCLIHLPKSYLILEVLKISYEDFLEKLIPEVSEPMKVTLRIDVLGEKSHKVSCVFSEPDEDVVLEYVPEHRVVGRDSNVPERMISRLRNENDKPKKERNEFQKNFLGKVKSNVTGSEFIYQTKVRYFSHFLGKCKEFIHEDFGRVLGDLRYLAYVAGEFNFLRIVEVPLIFPKIIPMEEGRTEIVDAYNPTLILDPERKGPVVPNLILIDEKRKIQAITGPNQNGKSRYMDTVGLNYILFQAGWPIFAKKAEISPRTDLRVRYVHSGVGISGESRFSNECKEVFHDFNGASGAHPLFLIDEPYTGTNYPDAETLLKEILLACSEEGVTVFLTTHFHGMIDFVSSLSNGHNLHCVIKEGGFTYKIEDGSSTESNALQVAENAGVRYESIKNILRKKKDPPTIEEVSAIEGDDDLPF